MWNVPEQTEPLYRRQSMYTEHYIFCGIPFEVKYREKPNWNKDMLVKEAINGKDKVSKVRKGRNTRRIR